MNYKKSKIFGVSLCYLDYLQDHGLEKLKQKQLEYLKVITIGGGEDEEFRITVWKICCYLYCSC